MNNPTIKYITGLLIVVPIFFILGQTIVIFSEGLFTLKYLVESIKLNFSIDNPYFLLFWFHIPATIIYVFNNEEYSGYVKFYLIISLGILFLAYITESSSGETSKDNYLSVNQVKEKSTNFLYCEGIYSERSYSLTEPYSRISKSEMNEPNIEIAFNKNEMFMRTKYIDRNDNKFISGYRAPQKREGIIEGLFLKETYTNASQSANVKISFYEDSIEVKIADLMFNPDIFTNSYYLCYEVK